MSGRGGHGGRERHGGRDTLDRALSSQRRAAEAGFDWDGPAGALDKVREETAEVAALLSDGPDHATRRKLEEELGDLLFAVVNLARLAGVDPVGALRSATEKFEARFAEVRRLAGQRGLPMPGTPLEPLDRLWDEVKRRR